ncbi:MAG: outer membrane protein assembly factor BamD [Planctomycetes bacterium]|nr:outer membrane protein assembly factor BamD [Planctomycetota bacterium]
MRAVAPFLLLSMAANVFGADDAWWKPQWTARRPLEINPTGSGAPGGETGVVEFTTLGRAAADGKDVRIVAGGQPVPYKVMFAGSDGSCVVALKMDKETKHYFAYFGNEKAEKPGADWEPERGLWLETRRMNGGDCQNWDQMKDLVAKSGPAHGADAVRQVFVGWDPFSGQDRWVSVYKGWLNCKEEGDYTFATSSDDASFVFVDGKLAAQFPGWHGAEGQARHTGKLHLTGGAKRFEYYHVNGGGDGLMAAFWQPPGEKKIAQIPADAFTPVARGKAGALEVKDDPNALDLQAEWAGEGYAGERALIRYRFRVLAPKNAKEVAWSFGDGQEAQGDEAEHVFFRSGLFELKVTAKAGGKEIQAAAKYEVHIDFDRQADRQKEDPKKYLERLHAYKYDALDMLSLQAAAGTFGVLEDVDGQIAAARALLARGAQINDDAYYEQALLLQGLLRDQKKYPDEALKVLDAAEERVKNNKNLRAKVLRERGDVYYFYKKDLDRALLEYDKVVGRYFGLEDNIVRVTKLRIGDIQRERGNYEKAAANYTDADRLRLTPFTPEQAPVRTGTLLHSAEDFLRRGDASEARKWVEVLEWEFPLERLRGQSTLLRAKIALLDKNTEEAQKQLETLERVNPDSPYTGEALFMLADLYEKEKNAEKVQALLKELVDKHSDSEFAPKAEERLKGKGGGKK